MVLSIRNAVNDKPHVTDNAKKTVIPQCFKRWINKQELVGRDYICNFPRVPVLYPEVGTALKQKRMNLARLSLYLAHLTLLC